ncbi:MAG: hypothetical protein M2R45_01583 [Verrucomicrobia subdivision 3 bacterium]|nr:hypothetical protein [Limisphaerales bacterium]MCS1412736.1 hypothetical protein [Limisphaerales bacterium]
MNGLIVHQPLAFAGLIYGDDFEPGPQLEFNAPAPMFLVSAHDDPYAVSVHQVRICTDLADHPWGTDFVASQMKGGFTGEMSIRKISLVCLAFVLCGELLHAEAEGWRFWKKNDAGGTTESTTDEAKKAELRQQERDREALEKELRKAQKKRAKEEKQRQEEFAWALKKKEREMARKQRDVAQEYKKMQRKQRRRLQKLSKQQQSGGKSFWRFWERSDSLKDFYLAK